MTARPAVTVTADALDIARAAGLKYLTDDRPGITRRKRGKGFSFTDARDRPVAAADRDRILALAIPPAWINVWIAPEPDAHLLATGIDAAGRKQYRYHEAWREAADSSKFERLAGFAKVLTRIRASVDDDLRGDGIAQVCAAAIRLVDESLIRPGSRRRRSDSEAVGVTTLQTDDVEIERGRIVLEFVGKSGVDQRLEVRDPQLARVLSDLLDAGDDGATLFTSPDGETIDERRLNEYIAEHGGDGFTAKDFRTWGASSIVVEELATRATPEPENDRAREAEVRDAIEQAALALGNTPAVCRSSYVAPVVIAAYGDGKLAELWRASRPGKWLSRPERALARLLGASA